MTADALLLVKTGATFECLVKCAKEWLVYCPNVETVIHFGGHNEIFRAAGQGRVKMLPEYKIPIVAENLIELCRQADIPKVDLVIFTPLLSRVTDHV